METLASCWTSDLLEKSSVWESQRPAGLMWTHQVSPHLQRNKQLQDTLLQREEELARLQDENNKLREFLSSSFVRNLEQQAKRLTDGRRKLKRNLTPIDDGPFQNQKVSKRVCRNLTAEFCSESSSSSEPNLDLWVLRTLGLKDRDTIDTSSDSSSSSGYGLLYNASVTSSSEFTLDSSFSSPDITSTPSSVQRLTRRTDYRYGAAGRQEANCSHPASSPQNCTSSPGSDFPSTGQYQAPGVGIRSFDAITAFQCPPLTEEPFRAETCSITTSSPVQAYWSPLGGTYTPSHDQFSPPGDRIPFSPISSSSPVMNRLWTSLPASSAPQTPRGRTDLAFSMSLSPSSSVKTHSFPQGQAFVRKDTEGRCNFTWVPTQGR